MAPVGTSGAGEQFFEADGVRYGHVIDPRTGQPASGVLSASVIASSAALADALSTAFLIGGVIWRNAIAQPIPAFSRSSRPMTAGGTVQSLSAPVWLQAWSSHDPDRASLVVTAGRSGSSADA